MKIDPQTIAQYLAEKGVLKDEYMQSNGKPSSTVIAYIIEAMGTFKENKNNMKPKLTESKLKSYVSKVVNELMEDAMGAPKEVESMEQLQKKLKGIRALASKVPADVKPKLIAKVKQIQQQIADAIASDADSDEDAKGAAGKDIKKDLAEDITDNEQLQIQILDMIRLSKISDEQLQIKRFYEAYSIKDALDVIASLRK